MKNLYILIFSLVLIACGNSEKNIETVEEIQTGSNEIDITKEQFKGEKMAFGSLTEQEFNETVKTNGMIDVPPHNKSSVTSFFGGYITKTPLLVGDKVVKGQLLVTLENTEYVEIQQNYLEVAEQLNYLKSEFTRQKTLFDENITSEKNFLKAESTYKSNLAHYNGLRKKLEMMHINPISVEQGHISSTINIYAPIEGHVTKVNVSNGTYVSPADIIMEIVDTDHIHLELSIFEKDILKIKKDQDILFTIPEASNKTFVAEVHLVGTTIDEKSRRVKVHGHIDNTQTNFIVGMFVEAEILVKSRKSSALPKEAIINLENEFYVLVLKNETETEFHLEKVKIEKGNETEAFVEILNIDALNDKQILTKGTYMLLNEGGGGHDH
ncbi:efflux RND transporter periplasmic adaptor subunit [Xanthomarina spongicola]|uniref:Cobalt-zinc-cadmium efflux system membrane fusion protein n=1 Tax=Xanthomarina spongicola TaxID=570520 RepID=A0A316EBL4_9FLAO|nr:efflux RND transporter periplasmic adaptor subunit [Xanthomarina spongicola]PWK20310.1 cobalt-zinc-cadmium efflux system membrane fusion protein [Xanthomarina spongicola]